jgi:TRAP-type C4-dicarboxylate transport system permease small subunit
VEGLSEAAVCIFIIMCLTTADMVTRTLFNKPLPGLYEVTEQHLLVGAAFFGMLYAYRKGALIRITGLVDHFPKPARLVVEYFALLSSFLVTVLFVIGTFMQFQRSLVTRAALGEWNTPTWPAYLLIPISLSFVGLAILMDITQIRSGTAGARGEETSGDGQER